MYKVIIADDESDVRDRLVKMVKNIAEDFEIVGIYENGYDALEGCTGLKPDLIITDIKMPYITGLELIKAAKISLPLVKSVIITGYDQFDYAKEAIKLGVLGYISKPISEGELREVLQDAMKKIEDDSNYSKNIKDISLKDKDYLSVVREADFVKLITLKEVPSFLYKKLLSEKVDIYAPAASLVVFDFDADYSSIPFEKITLVDYYLRKFIKEAFSEDYNVCIFQVSENICAYMYGDKMCGLEIMEDRYKMVLAKINKLCSIAISAGISEDSCNPKTRSFRKLYRHAKRALEYRTLLGGNEVIFFPNIARQEVRTTKIDSNEYSNITFELTYGNVDAAKERIACIVDKIYTDQKYLNSLTFVLTNITTALLSSCRNFSELYDNYMTQATIYATVTKAKEKENVINFLNELADRIFEINSKNREKSVDSAMDQVLNYIQVHYKDNDICMEGIGDELGFSISYISQLLKRKDLTFTKYLTSLRMEKAKQLLSDKSKKIINIAMEVGYTDPYYFSHCFKKYYGISPQGYKNNEKAK